MISLRRDGRGTGRARPVAVVLLLAFALRPARAQDVDSFIKRIKDPGERVRREAWEGAAAVGPAAIPALASVMAGDNRDAALAASNALARIVHACAAPGAACRKAAAGGLAGLLADGKSPVKVKLTALELLGSVGDDESVAPAAKALQDPETQDFARKTLERIPGEAAARALIDGVGGARGDFRTAIVHSLGKKKSRAAVPLLKSLAAAEGEPARIAAAEALARIGDPEALGAIKAALSTAAPRARRDLLDASLVMADGLLKAGDAEAARKIYVEVAAGPAEDGQKCAALHALLAAGPPGKDLSVFLAALEDGSPRVRAQAIDVLTRVEGEDASKAIAERFGAAKGAQRAMLLRAMAARKDPGLEKALSEASADGDIEVKVIALDLAGKLQERSNEPLLLAAMEKGSPTVRGAACAAYLALADGVVKKDPREATRMYSRILDYSRDLDEQGRALLGLAEAADPATLPRIEAARRNGELSRNANEAYITFAMALAKTGKKDEAITMLLSAAGSGAGRDVVARAVAGLKALGADPTQAQKKLGLVSSWWLVGPFPNDRGQGFARVYSPEEEVRLDGQKVKGDRTKRWVEVHSTSPDGVMDLTQSFQRTQNVCAYAYTELDVKEARDVKLKMGSDDGIICWLNGKKVHSIDTIRALRQDEDSVPVRLEAGKNKLLVKVTQGGGEWQFSMRITDRNDHPLDLTALAK